MTYEDVLKIFRKSLVYLVLPTLGLAASYGVYRFAERFVPFWVAFTMASSFELTYVGLALKEGLSQASRKRSSRISVGAVVVSVLYNFVDGLFAINPSFAQTIFIDNILGNLVLAFLFAAPVPLITYLVSDVLLHDATKEQGAEPVAKEETKNTPQHTTTFFVNTNYASFSGAAGANENRFVIALERPKEHLALPPTKDADTLIDDLIADLAKPAIGVVSGKKKSQYPNGRDFSSADYERNFLRLLDYRDEQYPDGIRTFTKDATATRAFGCSSSVTKTALNALIENDLLYRKEETYFVNAGRYDEIKQRVNARETTVTETILSQEEDE